MHFFFLNLILFLILTYYIPTFTQEKKSDSNFERRSDHKDSLFAVLLCNSARGCFQGVYIVLKGLMSKTSVLLRQRVWLNQGWSYIDGKKDSIESHLIKTNELCCIHACEWLNAIYMYKRKLV